MPLECWNVGQFMWLRAIASLFRLEFDGKERGGSASVQWMSCLGIEEIA
jgi:hypothetical protein